MVRLTQIRENARMDFPTRLQHLRALPPGLTFREIADQFGISYDVAIYTAHKANYKARSAKEKVPPETWQKLDWSQSDAALARRLKVTRALVNFQRHKRGLRKLPMVEVRRQQFAKLPPGLTVTQICRRLNLSDGRARKWIQRLGYRAAGYRQSRQDRQAQFAELAPGLTYKQVARRMRMSIQLARKWALIFGYKARFVGNWTTGGTPHSGPRMRRV
jgi:transposase